MSVDPTSLLIGVAAGGAAGLGVSYLSFYPRRGNKKVQVVQREEDGRLRKRTVTTEELEKSRREMRTVLLERDLLSAALTKVYEAENEGKITREEREMIARRYSTQIRDLETKLRDKELIVEVGELEKLRDELVGLFRDKIQNIETRLDQAKERLPGQSEQEKSLDEAISASRSSRPTAQTVVAAATQSGQSEDLERAVERKSPKRDDTEGERRVRAIRDEVMDALERLEQIDNRKENEST
ncbi:MAG: hypothetical protein OK455_02675 [Thaumarchaeota archaeon]|nr:hypothetical protein [Nitrososphaerota archaeon]